MTTSTEFSTTLDEVVAAAELAANAQRARLILSEMPAFDKGGELHAQSILMRLGIELYMTWRLERPTAPADNWEARRHVEAELTKYGRALSYEELTRVARYGDAVVKIMQY